MDSYKDYYKILNVSNTATAAQLKSAFRRMAKIYAPDVNSDPAAIKLFEDILEAWNILSNPATRSAYDQSIGFWQSQNTMTSAGPYSMGTPPQPSPPKAPNPMRFGEELRVTQTVIRPPRRETERQRAEEEKRRKRDGMMENYFDRGGVATAVLLSILLLAGVGLFGLSFSFQTRGLLKLVVSAALFAPAFWLTYWGTFFFLQPQSMPGPAWKKLSAIAPAVTLGTLYSLWMPWFMRDVLPQIDGPVFGKAFLLWGGPFILLFALMALMIPQE